MRLHALTVEAFGPYADRQCVDFDELNDAGVFLLTGPTGAGKTSILDAVCFALYGVVPGDREVRGLRSSHAAVEVPTRVELELTLAGRRLRVERWPEWERPKKRGTGTTLERAGARLFEVASDGTERLVSARVQEVGHELGPLLGMTSEQFKQVVLLPQGGFSAFLKADSDQRRDVLEKLFATQRFTRIESWVQDRAAGLRRRAESRRGEVAELLTAMGHRSGRARPDDLGETSLARWRADVLAEAQQAVTDALETEGAARERCAQAQLRAAELSARHAVLRRRTDAETELRRLEETADEVEEARRRLREHRRAAAVTPLLTPLSEAEGRRARAQLDVERALEHLPERLDRERCEAAVSETQRRLGELEGVRPLEARVAEAGARAEQLRGQVAGAAESLAMLADDAGALPRDLEDLRARLDRARLTASRLPDHEESLRSAAVRRQAAESVPAAGEQVERAARETRETHERLNHARTAHLDLVERRLRGMAAELAGELEDGVACQVCGSSDHPAPATPVADAVTREQQDEARSAAEHAQLAHDLAQQRLAAAREELSRLEREAGGLLPADARQAEVAASLQVEQASAAVEEQRELSEGLAALEARRLESSLQLDAAKEQHADLQHRLRAAEHLVAETEPQLRAVLGGSPGVDAAVTEARERLVLLETAATALARLADADDALDGCRRQAERSAVEAGFADLRQVRTAALSPSELDDAEQVVERWMLARARAQGVLDEPEVRALGDRPEQVTADDLEQARERASGTADELEHAVAARRAAEDARGALVGLDDQVAAALAAYLPVAHEHDVAESMSRLVRGMGGDNQLQMRLSSYVLATRLDQVLDAANERLQQMRDSRYTFHRSARARAGRRSGLDIEVLDDWTGDLRPPSSLSGGETFKLSLALALGLADVIGHESGGLEIETLFVDEGFGMLDADTLDEVMDCIDDLRSGGRAVGVVSHVTELRSRISTQLHVTPTREGSRIRLTAAAV